MFPNLDGMPGTSPRRRLVVLVPFREDESKTRTAQLDRLLSRFRDDVFVDDARPKTRVIVIQQSDDGFKFNRGHALNAGYALAKTRSSGEEDEATTTLYACHDCDMAPEPNAGSHYFCDDVDGVGFARVLRAAGCRYAGDACFGGVTIYDDEAFERTNGYPNGFWGWGGEDNAAYDRAMRAEVAVERATSVAFDDLENIDTVEEKLERLDAHDARIKMKEKSVLLKHNAKRWREDGINSCKFDVISETTLFETPNATAVKYLCEFKTRRPGYAMCVTCKEDLHERMYSSGALLKIRWADKTSTAHDRSCAACTQSMPKQLKEKAQVEFNRNNPERLTCKTCCEKFSSRNALFKHLKASTTCGEVTE